MKKRLIPCIIIIPLSEVDRNKTKFDNYLETVLKFILEMRFDVKYIMFWYERRI